MRSLLFGCDSLRFDNPPFLLSPICLSNLLETTSETSLRLSLPLLFHPSCHCICSDPCHLLGELIGLSLQCFLQPNWNSSVILARPRLPLQLPCLSMPHKGSYTKWLTIPSMPWTPLPCSPWVLTGVPSSSKSLPLLAARAPSVCS